MKVRLKEAVPIEGHVFRLVLQDAQTIRFHSMGPLADACREPINVTTRSTDPAVQPISNFAHTPFTLDGREYASIEGFWQGLKHPDERHRTTLGGLYGHGARQAGFEAPEATTLEYQGRLVRAGTWNHWQLMVLACRAKFTQHAEARQALLSTRDRPLMHRTRHDSRTIPGVIMADIWMRVRRELLNSAGVVREEVWDDPNEWNGRAFRSARYPRFSPRVRIRLCKAVRSVSSSRAAADTFQSV